MTLVKAMAMQGSATEEYSYAQNSSVQNQNFHSIAKPRLEKALSYLKVSPDAAVDVQGDDHCSLGRRRRQHVAIADLGCSYGRNTLDCAQFILQSLQQQLLKSSADVGTKQEEEEIMLEVQYFFADLPSNDFNALFHALQPYLECKQSGTTSGPKLYAAGVPGSFHGRLFPSSSLDFVICSYSLHWLSQVPSSITNRTSPAWNGGHAWIHKATQDAINSYKVQAKIDLKSFLKSRTHELRSGGILFLFLAGSSSDSQKQYLLAHHDPIWEIFDIAWMKMVDEGIITLDEMEMFNMPIFFLQQHEIENVLREAPEFIILHLETLEDNSNQENLTTEQSLALLISVTKPTVETYLGTCNATKLYDRLKKIALESKGFYTRFSHTLVIATLQRT